MADLQLAWTLYTEGRISEALTLAESLLASGDDPAVHAVVAFCHYRAKRYPEALASIARAGEHPRATACHMYILAYAAGYADDQLLWRLAEQLGSQNIDAVNALVIRARAADSALSHESVWNSIRPFVEGADPAAHHVSKANLLHNGARFYLAKPRDVADLQLALGLITHALEHYGQVANWHHRAAANLWRSHILEALGCIPQAFAAAVESLSLWNAQCQLEANVTPFAEKLDQACERVIALASKLKVFALRQKPAS